MVVGGGISKMGKGAGRGWRQKESGGVERKLRDKRTVKARGRGAGEVWREGGEWCSWKVGVKWGKFAEHGC